MAKKNSTSIDGVIDCACVIHSNGYDWTYVDRLYNMLHRNLNNEFRLHVYTEADRTVPSHMIKHNLIEWSGISGPRKSWWYKLQLFNSQHHAGNLLYLDLDMVLVRPIDWIRNLDLKYFWAVKDFRYLQKPQLATLNSSMMWWNVSAYDYVWKSFVQCNIEQVSRRFPGDQDYLAQTIDRKNQRFFEDRYFQSYRWQCLDGGFNFQKRLYQTPGAGVAVTGDTSVIVFHGRPKPHEVQDPLIQQHWC